MKLCSRLILVFMLIFSVAVVARAADDDSLFSDDTMTEEVTKSASQNETKALVEPLHIGGDFSFVLTPAWTYGNDGKLLQEKMDTTLNGRLYFDARPDQNSRFYGKFRVTYPFVHTTNVPNINTLDPTDSIAAVDTVNLQIQELFSDFNYKDKIFFRAGKHTIKWGVGYFFSPADVLNLSPIDPNDPKAEREGPVSLKVNYPFGENNLYGYLIANNAQKPDDLALAVKTEYLLGNLELGVGGFYQPELAPRAVFMATLPTSTVDYFGEAVLSYGSDKTFIKETEGLFTAFQNKDELFPSVTVGFNVMTSDWSVICQYLYNGEGYLDPAVLREYLREVTAGHIVPLKLGLNDLMHPGRHYGAAFINQSKLFKSNFGISLFWIEDFSDFSGQLKPTLSLKIVDKATASLSVARSFGETGTEFAPVGSNTTLSLGLNFGSGNF